MSTSRPTSRAVSRQGLSGSATPGRSSTYAVPTSPTDPVPPQAHCYASGYRRRWSREHEQFTYYPCDTETGANLLQDKTEWLWEAPPGYEPHYDSDIDYEEQKPKQGQLEDPEQQEELKQEDPQDQEQDTKEAIMTVNLTRDVLQAMLDTALDTGRQDAMNHINALLGGMPGGSQIVGWNAGVPTYATPNPIPTPAAATSQPTAQQPARQQPVVQVNARVRNEVHTANIETFTTGKTDGFMPVPVTTLMP